jgi:hypothetical protein
VDDRRDDLTANDQDATHTDDGGKRSESEAPPIKRLGDFDLLTKVLAK